MISFKFINDTSPTTPHQHLLNYSQLLVQIHPSSPRPKAAIPTEGERR